MSNFSRRVFWFAGFFFSLNMMTWGVVSAFREDVQIVAIMFFCVVLAVILGASIRIPEKTLLYSTLTLLIVLSWSIGVIGFVVSSISLELADLSVIQRVGIIVFLSSTAFAEFWYFHFTAIGSCLIFLLEVVNERKSK